MPKQLLISYTGRMPVEVDLKGALEREQNKAKAEKRQAVFPKVALERSGTLTLRQNTTAVVSETELEAVKATLGEVGFKRNVVCHGEHKPRKERGRKPPGRQGETEPEPEAESGPAPENPLVTLSSGKGKGKGK